MSLQQQQQQPLKFKKQNEKIQKLKTEHLKFENFSRENPFLVQ